MKRAIIVFIIALIFSIPFAIADEWEDISNSGNLWDGQKSITNDEFEKAINILQKNQKKKEARQKRRKIRKFSGGGTSLHPGLDPNKDIQALDPLKKEDDEGLLLNVPVHLYLGETKLETGFYNVYGEKEQDGNIYLSFYQSQFLIGKVKANETRDDFNSENINFVKMVPYNDDYVKIVYGSLDFNAYVYIRYVNP